MTGLPTHLRWARVPRDVGESAALRVRPVGRCAALRVRFIALLACLGLLVGSETPSAFAARAEPLELGPIGASRPTRRIGLFIGQNDGGPGRAPLRWAERDASAMADTFVELGGVATPDRLLLGGTDRQGLLATLGVVRAMIATTAPGTRKELIFYYSGHADERGLLLGSGRVAFDELRASLDGMQVDLRVAVIDACASGTIVSVGRKLREQRQKGGIVAAPILLDEGLPLTGYAYLSSAAADEVAQESDRAQASYFTQSLVAGLRGAADRDGDRVVTLTEAYAYAFDQTRARTALTAAGAQNPSWDLALNGTGDLALTRLASASATLTLDRGLVGRFTLFQGPAVFAELDKPAGRALDLAVVPGPWRVATVVDDRRREVTLTLASGRARVVSLTDLIDVGPVADARLRGASASRLRVALLPFVALPDDDPVVVHGASLALLGDDLDELRGAQLAVLFNLADEVVGAQIALVNIATRVRGVQIGLVNVTQRLDGASLALVPWVGGPDGLRHLEVFASLGPEPTVDGDPRPMVHAGWRLGARWLHTAASFGSDGRDCALRLGAGAEVDLDPLTLDVGLGAHWRAPKCAPERLFADPRVALGVLLGVRLAETVAVVGGLDLAVRLEDGAVLPAGVLGLRLFR